MTRDLIGTLLKEPTRETVAFRGGDGSGGTTREKNLISSPQCRTPNSPYRPSTMTNGRPQSSRSEDLWWYLWYSVRRLGPLESLEEGSRTRFVVYQRILYSNLVEVVHHWKLSSSVDYKSLEWTRTSSLPRFNDDDFVSFFIEYGLSP